MKKKKKKSSWLYNDTAAGYFFVMPFIIGFLCFTIVPIVSSFLYSFTNYSMVNTPKFVGLSNYIRMFTKDPAYFKAFRVTLVYVITSVPMRLVFALLVALLLNAGTRFTGFYRALYYLPTLVGGSIAISVTWKLMFQTEGLINQLLQAVGIDSHVGWLTQTKTALGVLIALSIWQFGASMIFFNLIMTLINGFVNFTQAYVITAGKPVNSTMMYVMYLYNQAFRNGNMGYACGMSSFRESAEILRDSVRLFPKVWTLENYIDGWKGFGDGGYTFGTYFWNTFVICVVGTIGAVISSTMVGYGFARIHFPGKGIWFICMMLTMMLPGQVLSIPQYILFNKLGWVGSNLPLIVPAFFGQGFFIFLTMQFIQGIPYELDEAARIDGCSRYSTFVHIILPLIKPAVITTTIFSFYWKWDDYFGQRLYLVKPKSYTVSVALKLFADPESLGDTGPMFAMAALSMLPVLIIFLFFQKYLVEGISTTGLKG